jgi:basic membrane protein A
VINAAKEAHKWAIGVDSDQYLTATPEQQAHILTSMLKRVDTAVYTMIKASVEKTPLTGNKVFDLKSDGVGYSTSNSIVSPFTAKADEFKAKIISGEITVPDKP